MYACNIESGIRDLGKCSRMYYFLRPVLISNTSARSNLMNVPWCLTETGVEIVRCLGRKSKLAALLDSDDSTS